MAEFRLYFVNSENHVIARVEFVADDDATALRIAAVIAENSADVHRGYMLWQGSRQIFTTDRDSRAFMYGLAAAPLPKTAQDIVLDLEEQILASHWALARSQSLLQASLHARPRPDSLAPGDRHRAGRSQMEPSRNRLSTSRPRRPQRSRRLAG